MPADDFHNKPFDEGTLAKLQIVSLYAREWVPVFLSPNKPSHRVIHLFDFFSGPGTDSEGEPGSPLRLLQQLQAYRGLKGWSYVRVHVHFFDESPAKIRKLKENISDRGLRLPDVTFNIETLPFEKAFAQAAPILSDASAAKLIFIDQFGVDIVTPSVFRTLVAASACDFLFFISSSTLHRFHEHPAIKQKITRPTDYYHVHRAVLEYYRGLLPESVRYFLAPFSIKKGSNIYGLIFGSAHPSGMDKFLQVAWQSDEISGEANFDIDRENLRPGEMLLPFPEMRPTKIAAFEKELEHLLRSGRVRNEFDVVQICFEHGVKRQHAAPVLAELKRDAVIELDFRVPDVRRWINPRPIDVRR
jgi:three-Cys-motif partner protein